MMRECNTQPFTFKTSKFPCSLFSFPTTTLHLTRKSWYWCNMWSCIVQNGKRYITSAMATLIQNFAAWTSPAVVHDKVGNPYPMRLYNTSCTVRQSTGEREELLIFSRSSSSSSSSSFGNEHSSHSLPWLSFHGVEERVASQRVDHSFHSSSTPTHQLINRGGLRSLLSSMAILALSNAMLLTLL